MSNKTALTPTFTDVMENFRKDLGYRFYCHLPGQIVSFQRAKGTASVKVALKQVIPDYAVATGSKQTNYPQLENVPVFILQGGGASIGADPKQGDPCLICIIDRNIDAWFQSDGSPQAPLSPRAHDLSDAFCFVGFNPLAKPLVSAREADEAGIADTLAAVVVKNALISIRNGPLPANNLGGILSTLFTQLALDPSLSPASVTALGNAVAQLTALLY